MARFLRMILVTGPPDEAEAASAEHRGHLEDLARRGCLHRAGAFAQGDGFFEIFEARDRLEADQIARSSPLVERGLCSWIVREWIELDLKP